MAESDDQLFARVVSEGRKTEQEIRDMVEKRKAATHGLLSDYGALYAVAKELGIEVNNEKSNEKIALTKLSEIKAKSAFNVAGRVRSVQMPKEFARKDGGSGKLASVTIADNSGEARLVLWDGHADIAGRVNKGDVILVRNGYGKSGLSGTVEVNAGSLSSVVVNPKIKADLPEAKEVIHKIAALGKNVNSVDLLCRVKAYYPATEFKRSDGSEGLRASFIAEDDTGTARVVLWGDAAKLPIERGDYVKIENAYTKEGLSQETEVHVGGKSSIRKTDERLGLADLPADQNVMIGDIRPDMSGFSTKGRVIRTYPPRAYPGGTLASILVADLTGSIRVVLWNEKSGIASELKKGDPVRIRNAYAKLSLNGEPEIHIGRYSELSVNQDMDVAALKDVEDSMVSEKKIIDLQEKDRYVKITGKIVDIDEGRRLTYMTCAACNKKVQNMGDIWFCESCNQETTPNANIRVSVTIEDETGSIRATAFRENAEKILGMDLEEVMNIIGETQDESEPVRQVKEGLMDKPITLRGRVKYSEFSDQLELIIEEVEA